jgi:hypothetical protein
MKVKQFCFTIAKVQGTHAAASRVENSAQFLSSSLLLKTAMT